MIVRLWVVLLFLLLTETEGGEWLKKKKREKQKSQSRTQPRRIVLYIPEIIKKNYHTHTIFVHKHSGVGLHRHNPISSSDHLDVKGKVYHHHHHGGKVEHLHKHKGKSEHEHKHHGKSHHKHKHHGEAEHEHKHEGHTKHKHKHEGHTEHEHKHEGHTKHKHKHSGHLGHKHKHKGKEEHTHEQSKYTESFESDDEEIPDDVSNAEENEIIRRDSHHTASNQYEDSNMKQFKIIQNPTNNIIEQFKHQIIKENNNIGKLKNIYQGDELSKYPDDEDYSLGDIEYLKYFPEKKNAEGVRRLPKSSGHVHKHFTVEEESASEEEDSDIPLDSHGTDIFGTIPQEDGNIVRVGSGKKVRVATNHNYLKNHRLQVLPPRVHLKPSGPHFFGILRDHRMVLADSLTSPTKERAEEIQTDLGSTSEEENDSTSA